jgi:hypothetical protein
MQARLGLSILGAVLVLIAVALLLQPESGWEGVDKAVVERFAGELGGEARPPLLNVQGDLLLFVFTIGGAAGGFVLGYSWRTLFGAGREADRDRTRLEETDV